MKRAIARRRIQIKDFAAGQCCIYYVKKKDCISTRFHQEHLIDLLMPLLINEERNMKHRYFNLKL